MYLKLECWGAEMEELCLHYVELNCSIFKQGKCQLKIYYKELFAYAEKDNSYTTHCLKYEDFFIWTNNMIERWNLSLGKIWRFQMSVEKNSDL